MYFTWKTDFDLEMSEIVRYFIPVNLQHIEGKRAQRIDWMIEGKALICTIETA